MFGLPKVQLVERLKPGREVVAGDMVQYLTHFYPVVRVEGDNTMGRTAVLLDSGSGKEFEVTVYPDDDVRVVIEDPTLTRAREALAEFLTGVLS